MRPKFSTLILLTIVSAVLLVPFALSPIYLDALRDRSFDLHQFLRGEIYKQGTGYAALVLVVIEMLLTARKRSRSWPIKVRLPGSVLLWRSLHIFTGVALLAMVVIHTVGAVGFNYNAVLLWSFVGVTLTALLGVVAETGILESPRKVFSFAGFGAAKGKAEATDVKAVGVAKGGVAKAEGIGKGALIRNLRVVWLQPHIWLVSVFLVLLAVHIFLVYYYR
ncbi:MAG: hypothetical protein AAFU53_03630 [Cyanobacteria bacterium J06632_3]